MKTINIYSCDFLQSFNILSYLKSFGIHNYFNIIINETVTEDTDFIFYGSFGYEHFKYTNHIKIFITQENVVPNFNICDYAIVNNSLLEENERCFYIPNGYRVLYNIDNVITKYDSNLFDRKFCSCLISNYNRSCDPQRLDLSKYISNNYKQISFGGKFNNNTNGVIMHDSTNTFLGEYKFNCCFENAPKTEGYITERIYLALQNKTIPIYLGTNKIKEFINEKAFINVNDFNNYEELIKYIEYIDNNENAYMDMLTCKKFIHEKNSLEELSKFLINIFECGSILEHNYGNIFYTNLKTHKGYAYY